jgi:hypothetical protein
MSRVFPANAARIITRHRRDIQQKLLLKLAFIQSHYAARRGEDGALSSH